MAGVRVAVGVLLGIAAASPAAGQRRMAVEVRGGAGVGNHAPAASDLGFAPGPSCGATVSYPAAPRVQVYAGYSRTGFGCEDGFCAGRGMTFTSRGVDAGVRVSLPAAASPWVRAGLVRHALHASPALDDVDPRSGKVASGVGIELGGGAELRLGRTLAVTPGVRYVRYGGGDDGVAVLVGDVGLRIRL